MKPEANNFPQSEISPAESGLQPEVDTSTETIQVNHQQENASAVAMDMFPEDDAIATGLKSVDPDERDTAQALATAQPNPAKTSVRDLEEEYKELVNQASKGGITPFSAVDYLNGLKGSVN